MDLDQGKIDDAFGKMGEAFRGSLIGNKLPETGLGSFTSLSKLGPSPAADISGREGVAAVPAAAAAGGRDGGGETARGSEQFATQLGAPSSATGSTEDTARAAEMATEKGGDLAEGFRAEMTGESIPDDAIYPECIERLFGADLNYTSYRQQWRLDNTLPAFASGTAVYLKARTLLEQYAPDLRISRPIFGPRSTDRQLIMQYEEVRVIIDGLKFLKGERKANEASLPKHATAASSLVSNEGATYSSGLKDKISVLTQVLARDHPVPETHTSGVHSGGEGHGVTRGSYYSGPHDSRSYIPNRKRALVPDQTAGERSLAPGYNPRPPQRQMLHRTFEEPMVHPDNVGHAGAPVVYVPPGRTNFNFGQLVPVDTTIVRL